MTVPYVPRARARNRSFTHSYYYPSTSCFFQQEYSTTDCADYTDFFIRAIRAIRGNIFFFHILLRPLGCGYAALSDYEHEWIGIMSSLRHRISELEYQGMAPFMTPLRLVIYTGLKDCVTGHLWTAGRSDELPY